MRVISLPILYISVAVNYYSFVLSTIQHVTCYLLYKAGYQADAGKGDEGDYKLIRDEEDHFLGLYDKPLPCFGCGIGWFSYVFKLFYLLLLAIAQTSLSNMYVFSHRFLLGFVFPPMWYYATFLYFTNYYHKDPRERIGLATSAIAVSIVL